MKIRSVCAAALVAAFAMSFSQAQEAPKPGPELLQMKKQEGTWDTVWTMGETKEKGVAVYKMELGGLWMVSNFESKMGNDKFWGKGMDSYDANKKKYVGVWCDSWSTNPMTYEGTFDAAKKTLTTHGSMVGPDGNSQKCRMTTEMPDDNTMKFSMFMADAKEPMFTIDYKRRK